MSTFSVSNVAVSALWKISLFRIEVEARFPRKNLLGRNRRVIVNSSPQNELFAGLVVNKLICSWSFQLFASITSSYQHRMLRQFLLHNRVTTTPCKAENTATSSMSEQSQAVEFRLRACLRAQFKAIGDVCGIISQHFKLWKQISCYFTRKRISFTRVSLYQC